MNFLNLRMEEGKESLTTSPSLCISESNIMLDSIVISKSHLGGKSGLTPREIAFYAFLEVFSPPSISSFPLCELF